VVVNVNALLLHENSQEAVQQALSNLIAESHATVVLVAHRLSTVVNADLICVIDKGIVLERGNHEELVAQHGGIYASMVEKQMKKKTDLLNHDGDTDDTDDDPTKKKAADDIDALLAGK
jgi:ABC-type multidrug transport system ATPase subunit